MTGRSSWPENLTPAAIHILLSLADEDRHGLAIMDEVERATAGEVKLGPGTLYGTIKKLREAGFLEEPERPPETPGVGPRRRTYRISEEGRRALRRETERLERIVSTARLKAVIERAEGK